MCRSVAFEGASLNPQAKPCPNLSHGSRSGAPSCAGTVRIQCQHYSVKYIFLLAFFRHSHPPNSHIYRTFGNTVIVTVSTGGSSPFYTECSHSKFEAEKHGRCIPTRGAACWRGYVLCSSIYLPNHIDNHFRSIAILAVPCVCIPTRPFIVS
jgi:hypothetical protein